MVQNRIVTKNNTLTKSCFLNPESLSFKYTGLNHSNIEWYNPNFICVLALTAAANSPVKISQICNCLHYMIQYLIFRTVNKNIPVKKNLKLGNIYKQEETGKIANIDLDPHLSSVTTTYHKI